MEMEERPSAHHITDGLVMRIGLAVFPELALNCEEFNSFVMGMGSLVP